MALLNQPDSLIVTSVSMIVDTSVRSDNIGYRENRKGSDGPLIVLEKFFQFVLVEDYPPFEGPNVHVYTSLVSSSDKWSKDFPLIDLNIKIDGHKPVDIEDSSVDFFNDIESIRLFWGKNSEIINNNDEISAYVREIWKENHEENIELNEEESFRKSQYEIFKKDEMLKKSDKIKSLRGIALRKNSNILFIREPFQVNVKPFFLLPQSYISKNDGGVLIGIGDDVASELNCVESQFMSVGSWIKASFSIDFKAEQLRHKLVYRLSWEEGLKCKDFSLYFGLPEGSQVQSQQGSLKFKTKSAKQLTKIAVETFGVHTQHVNPYFQEWIDKGIRDCSLVRLGITPRIQNCMVNGATVSLGVEIVSVDEHAVFSQRRRVLVQNIWFATFFALGFSTHQAIGLWGENISGGLAWLVMSLCILPTFFYRERYNDAPFIIFSRYLCWMLYLFWLLANFLSAELPKEWTSIILTRIRSDLPQYLFLFICLLGVFVGVYEKRRHLLVYFRSAKNTIIRFFSSRRTISHDSSRRE